MTSPTASTEDRFLEFVAEIGLPKPQVGAGVEVDGRWWGAGWTVLRVSWSDLLLKREAVSADLVHALERRSAGRIVSAAAGSRRVAR